MPVKSLDTRCTRINALCRSQKTVDIAPGVLSRSNVRQVEEYGSSCMFVVFQIVINKLANRIADNEWEGRREMRKVQPNFR